MTTKKRSPSSPLALPCIDRGDGKEPATIEEREEAVASLLASLPSAVVGPRLNASSFVPRSRAARRKPTTTVVRLMAFQQVPPDAVLLDILQSRIAASLEELVGEELANFSDLVRPGRDAVRRVHRYFSDKIRRLSAETRRMRRMAADMRKLNLDDELVRGLEVEISRRRSWKEFFTRFWDDQSPQSKRGPKPDPLVAAEQELVKGLLAIPNGSVAAPQLARDLLPSFREALERHLRRPPLRLCTGSDGTFSGACIVRGFPQIELDIGAVLRAAFIDAATDLRQASNKPEARGGLLEVEQVAKLLIAFGIRGVGAVDTHADQYAVYDGREPVADAVRRLAEGTTRDRLREIIAGRRVRPRTARPSSGQRRNPQRRSKGKQPAVRPKLTPKVGTDPDLMGTPLSHYRKNKHLP